MADYFVVEHDIIINKIEWDGEEEIANSDLCVLVGEHNEHLNIGERYEITS
jgi:hypothetical protein